MSKYAVKNCPCYFKEGDCCWDGTEEFECRDCTDCLMKKIVELCKSQKESCIFAVAFLADRILQLSEIEEFE